MIEKIKSTLVTLLLIGGAMFVGHFLAVFWLGPIDLFTMVPLTNGDLFLCTLLNCVIALAGIGITLLVAIPVIAMFLVIYDAAKSVKDWVKR